MTQLVAKFARGFALSSGICLAFLFVLTVGLATMSTETVFVRVWRKFAYIV